MTVGPVPSPAAGPWRSLLATALERGVGQPSLQGYARHTSSLPRLVMDPVLRQPRPKPLKWQSPHALNVNEILSLPSVFEVIHCSV